jgi:hypothetical protein
MPDREQLIFRMEYLRQSACRLRGNAAVIENDAAYLDAQANKIEMLLTAQALTPEKRREE